MKKELKAKIDELTLALEVERRKNHELIAFLAKTMAEYADYRLEVERIIAPAIERVIFNAPATIVFWSDGTKTKAKARGGDEYDPLFGMMACIVRKLTGNRGHGVDAAEGVIGSIVRQIDTPDDIEWLLDASVLTTDAIGLLHESQDVWMPQLGDADEPMDADGDGPTAPPTDGEFDMDPDAVRQYIRSLVDSGELEW